MDVRPPKIRAVDGVIPRRPAAAKSRHPLQFVPLAQMPATKPKPQAQTASPAASAAAPRPAQPPRTAPGISSSRAAGQEPAPPDEQLKSQPLRTPYRLDFTAPEGYHLKRRWWQNLLFPAAILLCLSASFVVQSLPLGIAAIALYAAVAWIKKIPSRVSFVMAFLAIVTVVVLLVVRQNVTLAGNFATYTFLLLVVAIGSTVQESQIRPKQRRSKIPHLHG
jgi:hypothetical protein